MSPTRWKTDPSLDSSRYVAATRPELLLFLLRWILTVHLCHHLSQSTDAHTPKQADVTQGPRSPKNLLNLQVPKHHILNLMAAVLTGSQRTGGGADGKTGGLNKALKERWKPSI